MLVGTSQFYFVLPPHLSKQGEIWGVHYIEEYSQWQFVLDSDAKKRTCVLFGTSNLKGVTAQKWKRTLVFNYYNTMQNAGNFFPKQNLCAKSVKIHKVT